MKVRASIKPMCEKCKIVWRKGLITVVCVNDLRNEKIKNNVL